jgi:hypothetical protein
VGIHLDRLAVEDCGAIAPLADRGESGGEEERLTRDYLQRLNSSICGDNGVKFNAAFAAKLDRQGWIDWFDAMDEHGRLNRLADFPALG